MWPTEKSKAQEIQFSIEASASKHSGEPMHLLSGPTFQNDKSEVNLSQTRRILLVRQG